MIKAVLFDYGGVLSAGGGHGSVRRMLAGALGIDEQAVRDLGDAFGLYMRGEITDDAFLQGLHALHPEAKRPGVDDMLAHTDIFKVSHPIYDLVGRLRKHGIKTGVLSNMFAFGAEGIRARGLFDGFDPVLLSFEAHYMKPEPKFYALAIRKLGVPSKKILFIDDQQEMIAGAERMGMQALLARDPAQVIGDTMRLVREQNGIEL